jgi:hypothetical protein
MAKKIVDSGPTYKRVVDSGEHYPCVAPTDVAAALGGEFIGKRDQGGSPLTVFLLRQGMANAALPAPPPPALGTCADLAAITLTAAEWNQLQQLAASLDNRRMTPTASQVASALLKLSLASPDLGSLRQELAWMVTDHVQ